MTPSPQPSGHERSLCGARTRGGGNCRRPAGWGTDHPGVGRCKLHGGATSSHRAAAQANIIEREAVGMLARLGNPAPLAHPVEELLAVAAEARAWQAVLRERVAKLDEFSRLDQLGVDRERALVTLYGRALDRTARVLVELAKLDLDARIVRVHEAQVTLLRRALEAVFADLDVAPERWQPVVAHRLAALEAS